MLNDFTPTGVSQLNLFDEVLLRERSEQLMKVCLRDADCAIVADEKRHAVAGIYNSLD